MPVNREIVTAAFAAWTNGTRCVTSIFADGMAGEIPGRPDVSRTYASA